MRASEIETKIYYAIRFIVKREARPTERSFGQAIPDTVALSAAEVATREIVRYQKEQHAEETDNRISHTPRP